MQKDFSIIKELQTIREEKRKLKEREENLSHPLLSDLSLIPYIYKWFARIQSMRLRPLLPENSLFRKEFVFLIMFLYSPGALAGRPAMKGVRDALMKAMGFQSLTYVSNLCADGVFQYHNYKDFRRDVDHIYQRLLEELVEKELLLNAPTMPCGGC